MVMQNTNTVSTKKQRAACPEAYKGLPYVKCEKGEEHTIVGVIYSTYQKKDEQGNVILSKRGNPVHKTTAYVLLDDGKRFTTVSSDMAVSQLISLTGEFNENEVGLVQFDNLSQRVRFTTVKASYGDKQYDVVAFEPL